MRMRKWNEWRRGWRIDTVRICSLRTCSNESSMWMLKQTCKLDFETEGWRMFDADVHRTYISYHNKQKLRLWSAAFWCDKILLHFFETLSRFMSVPRSFSLFHYAAQSFYIIYTKKCCFSTLSHHNPSSSQSTIFLFSTSFLTHSLKLNYSRLLVFFLLLSCFNFHPFVGDLPLLLLLDASPKWTRF